MDVHSNNNTSYYIECLTHRSNRVIISVSRHTLIESCFFVLVMQHNEDRTNSQNDKEDKNNTCTKNSTNDGTVIFSPIKWVTRIKGRICYMVYSFCLTLSIIHHWNRINGCVIKHYSLTGRLLMPIAHIATIWTGRVWAGPLFLPKMVITYICHKTCLLWAGSVRTLFSWIAR